MFVILLFKRPLILYNHVEDFEVKHYKNSTPNLNFYVAAYYQSLIEIRVEFETSLDDDDDDDNDDTKKHSILCHNLLYPSTHWVRVY